MRHLSFILTLAILVVSALVGVSAGEPAAKPIDPAKDKDIRQLLALTKADQLGVQSIEQLIDAFRQAVPNAPDEFWSKFRAGIKPGDLVELVVPIYDRHLTHDDVKAMLAFYATPAGRKMLEVQPRIFQESMAAGQEWGKDLSMKVQKQLAEAGFLNGGAPKPAPAPAPTK